MKRLVAVTLSFVMLMTLGTAAVAQIEGDANIGKVDLQIAKVEGAAGETVDVPVTLTVNPSNETESMDSLEFVIEYDASSLKLLGAKKEDGAIYSDIINSDYIYLDNIAELGSYSMALISVSGARVGGTLLVLQFEALKDVSCQLNLADFKYSFYDTATAKQTRVDVIAGSVDVDPDIATEEPKLKPAVEPTNLLNQDTNEPAQEPAQEQSAQGDWLVWVLLGVAVVAVAVGVVVVLKRKKK